MSNELTLTLKSYIQPFEKELAFREISTLVGATPTKILGSNDLFSVNTSISRAELANRVTYWERIGDSSGYTVSMQSLRESTVNFIRSNTSIEELSRKLPFSGDVSLPNRRCLRYGTHGIHEYRGKFFPQLVRSLINISGMQPGSIVADPMSGSGTTVVEAILSGCIGRGLDMNPLSVALGNSKANLLTANSEGILHDYIMIREHLGSRSEEPVISRPMGYFTSLPDEDQKYLRGWFAESVLQELDEIVQAIDKMKDQDSVSLARIALSNIIRSVSWQKDDDLRVRKELKPGFEIDAKKEFLDELGRSVRAVLAFLYQNGSIKASFEIVEGDARKCGETWGEDSIDLVITSPPYATALPYLDTDRLSLCYLGLLPRPAHRTRDKEMIGNREVTEKLRKEYWAKYASEKETLPLSVTQLIDRIHELNSNADVGFRRRNLPALLAKYFFDMKDVIKGIKFALKPGSFAYVVVGNNHTIAGGERVNIETASLLEDIARSVGFEVGESLSMEMLTSRDIFKENAMGSEDIIVFKKPQPIIY